MREVPGGTGAGTVTFILSDRLGGTVKTMNSSGSIVDDIKYWPFGTIRSGTATTTDKLFTGQRQEATVDPAMGLYDYNARFYSTTLGRFVSADSIVPGTTTTGFNRYAYANNNPLLYVDPSGHVPTCSLFGECCDASCINALRFIHEARQQGLELVHGDLGPLIFGSATPGAAWFVSRHDRTMTVGGGALTFAAGTFAVLFATNQILEGTISNPWDRGIPVVTSNTLVVNAKGERVSIREAGTTTTGHASRTWVHYTRKVSLPFILLGGYLAPGDTGTVFLSDRLYGTASEAQNQLQLASNRDAALVFQVSPASDARIEGPFPVADRDDKSVDRTDKGQEWRYAGPLPFYLKFIMVYFD